jgi:hypothetical protein
MMHSPCSLLAAAVLFALFISSPRCVFAQDNPATITNSIGMKFRKSWSDSVDSGSPPVVRAGDVQRDYHPSRLVTPIR